LHTLLGLHFPRSCCSFAFVLDTFSNRIHPPTRSHPQCFSL
jgi:hypothetical protein